MHYSLAIYADREAASAFNVAPIEFLCALRVLCTAIYKVPSLPVKNF